MYRSVVAVVLWTVVAAVRWTQAANECTFVRSYNNEQCVYNIHLTHSRHDCGRKSQGRFRREGHDEQMQNDDDVGKMDSIQKTFSFLKEEHEQRLRDLEGTVKALLGSETPTAPASTSSLNLENGPIKLRPSLDDGILRRLHEELGILREALKHKSRQLFDVRLEADQTKKMFETTQTDMLSLNENLAHAETKVASLEQERAVLKKKIKDRNFKMDASSSLLAECEARNKQQEQQLQTLVRSENTLSESLLTCEAMLNESQAEVKKVTTSQQQLKTRFKRVRQVLRIRERELIDCYGAKTQTFCGFETDTLCGFTQARDSSDFFDWDWARGSTPSRFTGPSIDHTCGTPDGHFMFIEASAKGRGHNAIIYSPLYRGMMEQCVEFYYHMYGRNIGTLNVYAKARGAELTSVWRAWGNQGDIWSVARLAIPKPLARAGYQIAFEGITEYGYEGDISIDDVSVTDGDCEQGGVEAVKVYFNSSLVIDDDEAELARYRRRRLERLWNRIRRKKNGSN